MIVQRPQSLPLVAAHDRGIADDVTVDQIAKAPEDLPDGSKEGGNVKRQPDGQLASPGDKSYGCRAQEDSPEKGHATIPDGNDIERFF